MTTDSVPQPDAAPVRFCPVCKTADDHPRHDIFGTDPQVAPHMDCCASVGCPDGSCTIQVRDKGDKVGDTFREQLTDKAFAKATVALLEKRPEEVATFTHDDIDQKVHGSIMQQFIALRPAGSNQ